MSLAPAKHEWLRRVSDYHSGGVSEAERAAVEAHVATCQECQAALTAYRRFYSLLRSPLRLSAPAADLTEDTAVIETLPRPSTVWSPSPGPRRRPRALAGFAAALAAALVVAGFLAVYATRLSHPTVAHTPTPRATALPTVTPSVVPTVEPTATQPAVGQFICANPQGSSMTYAYQRADGNLYAVTGCDAPRQLTQTRSTALAWSPSNRYLAIVSGDFSTPDPVSIVDLQTGAIASSGFAADFGMNASIGKQVPIYFGWLDDTTFLGGVTTVAENTAQGFWQPGSTKLVRVDVRSGTQTTVGSIPGWANVGTVTGLNVRIVANGRYLFYVGYDSASRTGYLHRFDLTTGANVQLVSLGLYTNGGCQVTPMCGWTAPWDVSPDGSHILYHNPGASSGPSDTGPTRDTPVYYANPDGSGASRPFGAQLSASLVSPIFSPDGTAAVAAGWQSTPPAEMAQLRIVRFGGAPIIVDGDFGSWRGDDQAVVINQGGEGTVLYDLTTVVRPLEANSGWYLWAH